MNAPDRARRDLATFVTLSAATGARRSELLALRWDDLDLVRRVVTISRGIVNGPDGLVEKDTKTHQARRVTLDSATVAALAVHHERAVQRTHIAQVELRPGALLFSRDGPGEDPWYPDSITRRFHRLCQRAGLEGVRLHDLRHYVAMQLLAAGVEVAAGHQPTEGVARCRYVTLCLITGGDVDQVLARTASCCGGSGQEAAAGRPRSFTSRRRRFRQRSVEPTVLCRERDSGGHIHKAAVL